MRKNLFFKYLVMGLAIYLLRASFSSYKSKKPGASPKNHKTNLF